MTHARLFRQERYPLHLLFQTHAGGPRNKRALAQELVLTGIGDPLLFVQVMALLRISGK